MLFRKKKPLNKISLTRPHFKPKEFIKSSEAKKHKIKNDIYDVIVLINLNRLADVLEFFRVKLNCRIDITSAYRCPALNKIVSGSRTSDHPKGNCADITSPYGSPEQLGMQLFKLCIKYEIEFDQILIEEDCVHVSIKARGYNRNELAYWINGKKTII